MTILRFTIISVFISLTISVNGAEDCFNGIDDDNDGLIDANDPDCLCCPSTGGEYVLDGFFDVYECFNQSIDCLAHWNQNYSGSPDYIHPDIFGVPPSVPPLVVAGGMPGILGGMSQSYREGISQCLPECISRGEDYNLSFKFFSSHSTTSGPPGTPVGNSTEAIQVFGVPLCSDIEGASFDCPNSIDFDLLATGTNPSAPTLAWHDVDVTFTACRNYEAILIMHSCDAPIVIYTRIMGFSITGPGSPVVSAEPIIVTGDGCSGYILEAPNAPAGSIIQWYKEGIAIVGESGQFYYVPIGEGGNYSYGLFIDSGCDYTDPVYIEPYQVMELTSDIINPSCYGYDDASVELLVEFGTPPYVMTLDNVSVGTNVDNLQAGSYTLNVTDDEGCTATFEIIIENPNMITGSVLDIQPVDPLTGLGSAEVIGLNSDNPPYLYIWDGGQAGPIVDLPEGTHIVTIYDENNCSVELVIEIPGPPLLADQEVIPSCPNMCNGEVTIQTIGGQVPYSITWGQSQIQGFNPNNLCPGRYSYVISDAEGQTIADEIIIEETPVIDLDAIIVNPPCSDTTGGSISLIIDTITNPVIINWMHGGNAHFIDNLLPDMYTVTIGFDNNCFVDSSFTIFNEFDVTPTVAIQPSLCALDSLGSIDVILTNDNNGYSILWQDGATSFNRDSLPSGQFSYIITQDSSNCQYSESITIIDPDTITAGYQFTNFVCTEDQNGSITIDTTGFSMQKMSFAWQDAWSLPDKNNLGPGIQRFTIFDSIGCQNEFQVEILESPQPVYSFDLINPDCIQGNNGSITLISDDSLIINWDQGSVLNIIDSLIPGSYSVMLTDSFNCTYSDTLELTEQLSATFEAEVIHERCDNQANGSILLTTTQGMITNYLWSNGPTAALNNQLSPGIYEVTITDSDNCTAISEFSILPGEVISYNTTLSNNICFGDSAGQIYIIDSLDQYNYQWEHTVLNASSITNLKAGFYNVEIVTPNGCSARDSFRIQEGIPMIITGAVDSIECENNLGRIQLQIDSPNGPFDIDWDNGATDLTIDNLTPNTYSVTITDSNQCQEAQSFDILPGFSFDYSSILTDSVCIGQSTGTIELLSPDTYNYAWDDGQDTGSLSGLSAGEYYLTLTSNFNNCATLDTFIIENFVLDDFDLLPQDALCHNSNDGTILLMQNGVTIQDNLILDGMPFHADSLLGSGIYTLRFIDNKGCIRDSDFEILAPPPIVSIPFIQNPSCFDKMDGFIDLNTTGGTPPYVYNWSNGAISEFEEELDTGVYNIIVLDDHNCMTELTVDLSTHLPVHVSLAPQDLLCDEDNSGSISIVSSDALNPSFYINGVATEMINTFDDLALGSYEIAYHHSPSCIQIIDTVNINTSIADFDIEIGTIDPSQYYPGDEAAFELSFINQELIENLTITGNGVSICQTNSADDCSEFIHTIDEENILIAVGVDTNNCLVTDTLIFYVEGIEIIQTIPNIFSPNADSNNDKWQIEIPIEADQVYVSIYDRWGNAVFRTFEHSVIWDGTFNGSQVQQGVYVVQISYSIDGVKSSYVGDITVIR